jgi:hypothetical protein
MSIFKPTKKKEFGSPSIQSAIASLVDEAKLLENKRQKARDYLGASRWGEECLRRLRYEFEHVPVDQGSGFRPDTLRIFDMGHDGEARAARYLQSAGFKLDTVKPDGSQFGFRAAEGKLGGHCDGIIVGGPELGIAYPLLWENKALNDKSWNYTKNKGVRESKPVYFAQLQVYMGYFELENSLFTAINRDTGEMLYEVVPLDAKAAQEASDRALRVVTADAPEDFARIGREKSDFRCKWCPYNGTCWEEKQVAMPTSSPSWLKR